MVGGVVLVSTFYSFQPFVAAAHAFSPSKIVLVIAEESFQKIEEDVKKVREVYGKVASVELVKVRGANILSVASKTVELIEENKESKIVVNVSGGWKLLAQGVLYGCYARIELVNKIVCNDIETNSIVELPKLSFGLSAAKKELLKEIAERNGRSIAEIAEKLGKTRGMAYQHLKELKENGFTDEEFEITLAGRMALL